MSAEYAGPIHEATKEWMALALQEAARALAAGEAPIGAVLVNGAGDVMSSAHNSMRKTGNPTAHAEINAFAAAAGKYEDTRDLCLVTTLEPCVMCTGAAMQVGVTMIVYGLKAPADSGTSRVSPPTAPDSTNPEIVGGLGAVESRALFVKWMERHADDSSRDDQRKFISQLLTLTAGDATHATELLAT